jgi:hypothetical protein
MQPRIGLDVANAGGLGLSLRSHSHSPATKRVSVGITRDSLRWPKPIHS